MKDIPDHYYTVPAYYRKHRPNPKVRIVEMCTPPMRIRPAIEIHIPHVPWLALLLDLSACVAAVLAATYILGNMS